MKMNPYTPDDYDKNLCLKPSFELYVILFFGIKDFLLVIIPAIASFKTKSTHLDYLSSLVQPEMFIADMMVIFVWLALINRRQGQNSLWMRIWNKGRMILAFSYSIQAVILAIEISMNVAKVPNWIKAIDFRLASLFAVTLFLLITLLRNKRIKETFLDWPEQKSAG